MDKQALEQRITAAEKELTEMRELLKQEDTWEPSDIVPGLVVGAPGPERIMVLSGGHGTGRFYIGGLFGDALKGYSNENNVTARRLADYFNEGNYVALGNIASDINTLLTNA